LGPMVIAAVTIDEKDEKRLVQIGVKDSKKLSPKKRDILSEQIERIAKNVVVVRVPACKIDSYRAQKINLDRIEAMKIAELIQMVSASKVYIDSLETPKRFEPMILSFVQNLSPQLVVENYADETYPVVSAASIIAKVERDKSIDELKKKVGYDFGVGYSHDNRTRAFVEKLIKESRGKELPPFVRKSWITTQVLMENSWQRKLKDFIFGKREKCKEGNS